MDYCFADVPSPSRRLLLEFVILRHQLAVLQRAGTRRPCFRPADRLFWILLSHLWVDWRRDLMIVQPATVLRWRRQGLRSIWTYGSRGRWRGGRPRVAREIRDLIVRMSRRISCGARRGSMANCLNWGSTCRRLRCPATCRGGTVCPRRLAQFPAEPGRWCRHHQFWRSGRATRSASFSRLSGWIERVVRYATKVWDGLRSALAAPQGTLQPCSSHSANRIRHAVADTCIPINPRSAPSRGAHWMMTDRRLRHIAQGHRHATPRPQPAALDGSRAVNNSF